MDEPGSESAASASGWTGTVADRLQKLRPLRPADRPPRDAEAFDLGRGAYFDLLERHLYELRLESMTYRRMVDRLIQEGLEPGLSHKDREVAARQRHRTYYQDAHRAAQSVLRQQSIPLDEEIGSARWRHLVRQERSDYLVLLSWLAVVGAVVAFIAWLLIDLG